MKLQELAGLLEIDVQGSLEDRFMNNEALYTRFLKKLPADKNMAAVEQRAHALKGVCGNLGLTGLAASCALLVSMARRGDCDAARLAQALARAKEQYALAVKYIGELE